MGVAANAQTLFDLVATAIDSEPLESIALENVSAKYRKASRGSERYCEEIRKNLPPELQLTLQCMDDERSYMEAIATELYYRKGFCDAIRLLVQTLTWEPARH